MSARGTKFILTLDTEEDNWGNYAAREASLTNIRSMPDFQAECRSLGIRPTYLLTYPVISDSEARDSFSQYAAADECELGTHCHPWNTPPFDETPSAPNSMLNNLPDALQGSKLETLTNQFAECFGFRPRSFRAGRWGFGASVSLKLAQLGYAVDSSVIPLQSWTSTPGSDYSRVPIKPYWRSISGVFPGKKCADSLVEVPVTVGFLQRSKQAERLFRTASQPVLRRLHAVGILERLSLANRVALLPEVYSLARMIQLTERLIEEGVPYLNFSFHSCTLTEGLTPFTKTQREAGEFRKKIFAYLDFIRSRNIRSITLSEAAAEITETSKSASGKTLQPVAPLRNVSCG